MKPEHKGKGLIKPYKPLLLVATPPGSRLPGAAVAPRGRLGFSYIIHTVDDRNPALRTLNYGNYGIFLIMGNAGFISSTVGVPKISAEGKQDTGFG